MSKLPKIDSQCPYPGALSDIVSDKFCSLCEREVHDLEALAEVERLALLRSHKQEICVSYRFPLARAAAAVLAAATFATPLGAAAEDVEDMRQIVIVGAIKTPDQAALISDEADEATPELPVVFEPALAQSGAVEAAPAADASPGADADLGDPLPAQ